MFSKFGLSKRNSPKPYRVGRYVIEALQDGINTLRPYYQVTPLKRRKLELDATPLVLEEFDESRCVKYMGYSRSYDGTGGEKYK